ncbi:MAG: hypothetical protein ABH896_03035 [Candidatus Jacksonbacteria bacterium]
MKKKSDLKQIIKDIIFSYNARVRIIAEIVKDTHETLADFRQRRQEMSQELRELLAQNTYLRKKDFDRMMVDIIVRQNSREEEVKKTLEDFRQEEERVAEAFRKLLKKGEGIRINHFKKMMTDIRKEQEKRAGSAVDQIQKMRQEVHAMLDRFKQERLSVAGAWNQALSLLNKQRSESKLKKPKLKNYELKKETNKTT